MVLPPSDQSAGQTSPYLSCNKMLRKVQDCLMRVTYGVLKSLDETEGLINRTTNRKIVDGDLSVGHVSTTPVTEVMISAPEDTLGVDDEETTESNALLFEKDTVVASDAHATVSK